MGRKILLAIDDSEHSTKAWEFYLHSIRHPEDEVLLLHCVEIPYGPEYELLRSEVIQNILDKAKAEGRKVEDKFKKLADENKVGVQVISEFGSPGELIVKKANQHQITLIIMGTRGMGKIRRTILGSVSDYVVHHAHCPVLVTRS